MEHKSNNTSIIDCSWSVRFKRKIDVKIDILGDNGSLVISDDTVLLYLDKPNNGFNSGKTTFNANDLFRPVPIDIGTPKFTFQDIHFLDSIRLKKPASPDIKQGFHVQQVVDAGYRSSLEGCIPIAIKLI